MNGISESLFQKSFAECTAAELRQLTAQYPYFAPAHYLLLKKFDPATAEYREQYQRALLYFHDPLSFGLFLEREHAEDVPVEIQEAPAAAEPISLEEHEIGIVEEGEAPEVPEEPLMAASLPATGLDLAAPPTGDLSFEPFHTVDYFASQGIKLSQQEVGSDKLGKQLRSFTDWLKTMKRISPEKSAPMDAQVAAGLNQMADRSVSESEILTEAMAEVWIRQGNVQKATEIYRKLSLLHPAKSVYFADKIKKLTE